MSEWSVVYLEPNDPVDLTAGYAKVVLEQQSEAAARLIFADKVRVAASLWYAAVQLRCGDFVMERWPVVADDDPDVSDLRRAAALISHRATTHLDGVHWALIEATDAGRLAQLLRAVDVAYRIAIGYFQADLRAIDEEIQRFTTAEDVDSFGTYNRYAAQAIMAMRAEDRAALNDVIYAVNREAAAPRLVGAVCDVYAGLLPQLSTPEGHDFLSTWTARITAIEDQLG